MVDLPTSFRDHIKLKKAVFDSADQNEEQDCWYLQRHTWVDHNGWHEELVDKVRDRACRDVQSVLRRQVLIAWIRRRTKRWRQRLHFQSTLGVQSRLSHGTIHVPLTW